MSDIEVIELCRTALITLVFVAGPLGMVPKVLVVFGLSILLMPYMLGELREFFNQEVADRIIAIGAGG